jgi:hypothetical protein
MPPTTAHFNGGVNLADAETVMREIAARVPSGVSRVPDGETGDRQNWIFFQLQRFWQTPGVERTPTPEGAGYEALPKVRLAEDTDPDQIAWSIGYAEAYQESYRIFSQLRAEGVLAPGIRFQVQYPTPLASINAWFSAAEQARVEPSYERAIFADLDQLLDALPHDDIAVQWDVAVEIGMLAGGFEDPDRIGPDGVAARLARCVDRVPAEVPVGLHLCYGDYEHHHFVEPESLGLQVGVINALTSRTGRPVNWYSLTVPQYQRDESYFAPLRDLRAHQETELYLALVPYHPEEQEAGTTAAQIGYVDRFLGPAATWGICTECGMARAASEEVPGLLDLHREILAGSHT